MKNDSRSLGELRLLVIGVLQHRGGMTASNVGAHLWGTRHSKPQSFARPAGRVLHSLKRDGLVEVRFDHFSQHWLWTATAKAHATVSPEKRAQISAAFGAVLRRIKDKIP